LKISQITGPGTVILNVVAENASSAVLVGGANPAINRQSMMTQVTVPDGGTTVIGGVLFDDERESQDRTPGLASIPILGNLFKRRGVQRNTNEILFFITPRITRPDYNAVYNGPPPAGRIIPSCRWATRHPTLLRQGVLRPSPLCSRRRASHGQSL